MNFHNEEHIEEWLMLPSCDFSELEFSIIRPYFFTVTKLSTMLYSEVIKICSKDDFFEFYQLYCEIKCIFKTGSIWNL